MRPLLRDFLLRHLSAEQEDHERSRRHAARAHHVVGRAGGRESERQVRQGHAGRGRDLHEGSGRLVESTWRRERGRRVTALEGVMAIAKRMKKNEVKSKAKAKKKPAKKTAKPKSWAKQKFAVSHLRDE